MVSAVQVSQHASCYAVTGFVGICILATPPPSAGGSVKSGRKLHSVDCAHFRDLSSTALIASTAFTMSTVPMSIVITAMESNRADPAQVGQSSDDRAFRSHNDP